MPTARVSLAAAAGANGKIYAIGGNAVGADATDQVEEYDPATNTWTVKAHMPTARYSLAAATAPNGKIYAWAASTCWANSPTSKSTIRSRTPG